MGRKSRIKKERKLQVNNAPVKLSNHANKVPGSVYRFFKEEWQAEALCRGEVWVSTLEECRGYEDPLQGDPDEAKHTYRSGTISGGSSDPGFVEVASRCAIYVGGNVKNFTISDFTIIHSIRDAYVLCTTKEFSPDVLSDTFGNYCVEIINPNSFYEKVTAEISKKTHLISSSLGEVKYRRREFSGLDVPPGKLGFVKTEPKPTEKIEPFLVTCPPVAKLCKRIA